jgi:Lrp/AsnC family leucine-responsive transcriptional regulator
MDKIDLRILAQLQADSSRSHAELADAIHLSSSQVSRRIAKLEQDGIIRQHVALLDEEGLGLQVEAFVTVAMTSYAPEVVTGFQHRMSALDQVVDCCATTGDADYLLRVVAHDLRSFSAFINQELLGHGDIAKVHSSVVLERIKRTTALPLPAASH